MATSEARFGGLLDGLDASTLNTLARNDIRSIDDLQALSAEDIKELGLSVGHRNRLRRRIAASYTATSGLRRLPQARPWRPTCRGTEST